MCGIVGIVPRNPADPDELGRLVRRMASAIEHRGPDDEGFFVTPEIALGNRRLSIIDVAGGHQPMQTPDGSKVVVFNGEIYNHQALRDELRATGRQFRTSCDTEAVLLAFDQWGKRGFERLEGMFGAAVWDQRRRTLTLARDWLGQKSIYYAEIPMGFAFASEIKALLTLDDVPRELDVEAMSHYMSLRYLPKNHTFFKGVSKLPAAHVLEVTRSQREATRYWTPSYEPKWTGSEETVLDELDGLLEKVVGEHLMSEVPLGAFLSGGIDSSLVVAYAARASGEPLRTFSIGVGEETQSELPWARQVAERYGTRHFEEIAEPELASLAPRMVASMEEPVDPLAAGYYVVCEVASKHVTVALGGDGGDELFAGYDRYIGQQLAEIYALVPAVLRRKVLRPMIRRIPDSFGYNSLTARLRWLDSMADHPGFERYAESAAYLRFPHARKAALFTPEAWSTLEAHASERLLEEFFTDGSATALVDKMLHTDCMTRLMEHQLPIVDKMAMAHSLEVRSPFLDRRIAEFAMRIPAEWKMKSRRIKYMTRTLGERYLSRELLYRTKQGFGFPLALWLRGELRGLLERTIAESRLADAGIFSRDEMNRLLVEHADGGVDHNYRLWMLFNLELFYRHYFDETPVDELEEWVARCRKDGSSKPGG